MNSYQKGLHLNLMCRNMDMSNTVEQINKNLTKECSCMKKKKLLFAILCALGSGTVGFFANQLTEVYGCILFGIGVGLMVYSMINLSK